jgi:virginiamycin B lyase
MSWRANRKTVVWIAVAAIALGAQPSRGADRGTIAGVVKNASGAPVEGALIKAKHLDRGLMVTVISQGGGKYTVTSLPPGKYSVQAWGGGFESAPKNQLELSAGQNVAVNLDLTERQNFVTGRTITQWTDLMPEGEGKSVIVSVCTDCHHYGLYEIISQRKDRNGWMATIEKMQTNPSGAATSGDGRVLQIWDREKELAIEYLAKHFGPGTPPLDTKAPPPATWVKGPAAKAVVTEYPVTAGASPHDVAVDSKGIGWVTEGGHGVIGRFDPNTFAYTRIPLPGGKSSTTAIEVDEQDRVWVSDGRNARLVRYDPGTGEFTSFALPKPPEGTPNANTIRFHPNGTVWFTEIGHNKVVRLDPATGKVTEFPVPAGVAAKSNVNPYGMAIDGEQKIWFAERRSDKVARIDPVSGEIAEYPIPTRGAVLRRMAADAEGNLWFGQYGGIGKLAKIDYRTSHITEFPTPTKYSGAYSVSIDKKRNVIWFNEMMADQIARFDPRTKTFVEYPIPTRYSSIRRIELDRSRPNRVWFSGSHVDTVGYLDVVE